MEIFRGVKDKLTLALRIAVANIFLTSLFSYQNRHFIMPESVVKKVENHIRDFITPIGWVKLGLLSHVQQIYGIKVALRDICLSNVASLLASYGNFEEIMRGVENTTAGDRPDYHPAVNWRLAFHFLLQTTGLTPEDVANKVTRARDQENPAKYSAYKDFYKVLLEAERPHWEGYLRERVRARGWDGETMLTQLRKLPRSTPQAHRWFLLKIQLNGPMTKSRIAKAVKGVEAETCFVCRAAEDTVSHLTECEGILEAYTRVQRGTGSQPYLEECAP